MIQPIIGAIDAWLGLYNNLSFPIRALVGLAIALFIASRVIQIVWTVRR